MNQPGHARPPHRHPRGRQGHADEVRAAQGAAPRRRPAADRARARDAADACRPAPIRSSSGIRPSASKRRSRRHPASHLWSRSHSLAPAHALLTTEPALAGATGTLVLLSGDVPLLSPKHPAEIWSDHHDATGRPPPSSPRSSTIRTATAGSSETASRLHVSSRRRDATPGRTRDPRDQLRHLRVRARGLFDAVRRIARDKRAGRVLPARSRRDLSPRGRRRRDRAGCERGRDSRHQQPRGAGGSEPNRETSEKRRS